MDEGVGVHIDYGTWIQAVEAMRREDLPTGGLLLSLSIMLDVQ